MRDGVVSVAGHGARPSVSLLRVLKREFGFYCIQLVAEQTVEVLRPEMAYVLGGIKYDDERWSSMEQYNASSGQWSALQAMTIRRRSCGACVVEGEIYVTGGRGDDSTRLSSVERYSPPSDTWSAVAPMPATRSSHCAVSAGCAIYVMGGFGFGAGAAIASVLKFDSTQGTWTEVAPMPGARCATAACFVGSDIYVFGGKYAGLPCSSVYKYDIEANEWSTLMPMPRACKYHSAQILDGLVYIVGAGIGLSTLCFDPATAVWSVLAQTSVSRRCGSSFILNGILYAAGGEDAPLSVERYDVASDTWTAVENMLESRTYFAAVTVASMGPAEEEDLFNSLIAKAGKVTSMSSIGKL
jgi:N-acetylneuraminic acid mutarotase